MWSRVAAFVSATVVPVALIPLVAVSPALADSGTCPTASGGLSGTGTSGDPYLIEDAADLQEFRNSSSYWGASGSPSYTRITANIDMGSCTWSSVIGSGSPAFFGEVDGGGFQVTGLDISGATNYVGLFGITGTGTHIYDLSFSGDVVNTARYTGGLIGYAANNTRVTSVHASGSVTGASEVGGLIGNAAGNSTQTVTVADSSATGEVSGSSNVVGGLIGYVQYVSISNTFSRGDVSATTGTAGGLLGSVSNNVTLSYSYSTGNVTVGSGASGGLTGLGTPATTTDSYWDTDTSVGTSTAGTGKTTAQLQDISTFSTWSIASGYDASSTWGICSAVNDGYPFLTGAYSSDPCASGNGGATGSAPPARYTFIFKLPDGRPCTSISPVTVIDGEDYVLPGMDADCRSMPGATVAGWTIPVPAGFTGAGSEDLPFSPGHVVQVSGSQQFTVVPFEPLLSLTLDSNVRADEACDANEVGFVDELHRVEYSWVPRSDFSMARLPLVGACQPPGYTLAGWNTAADGSGTMLQPGAGLPSEWKMGQTNRHRLFAIWTRS